MYVHMNCFDYNKLLTGIIEYYHMQDEPITNEWLESIFNDLAKKFKTNNRDKLTSEEIKMVEDFLKVTITYADFEEGDDETFKDCLAENIAAALVSLEEVLNDPSSVVPEQYETFLESIINHPGFDLTDDGADGFAVYLMGLIEDYLVVDFTPGEMFILSQIEIGTNIYEIIRSLEILPLPGKMVKYGDTLITFPIILIEVTEQ